MRTCYQLFKPVCGVTRHVSTNRSIHLTTNQKTEQPSNKDVSTYIVQISLKKLHRSIFHLHDFQSFLLVPPGRVVPSLIKTVTGPGLLTRLSLTGFVVVIFRRRFNRFRKMFGKMQRINLTNDVNLLLFWLIGLAAVLQVSKETVRK